MAVFTKRSDGLDLDIVTKCSIFSGVPVEAIRQESDLPEGFHTKNALWDTGAETTLISPQVVKKLGLTPFDQTMIEGVGGTTLDNTYIVHIKLPSEDFAFYVEATETEYTNDYDVIIGMDIISKMDFAFTNKDDKSVFSFRFPSEEHIDFNKK